MIAPHPTRDENLPAVCAFLHHHLNPKLTVAQWRAGLSPPWESRVPNHGFHLWDGGRVVGAIGALYSRQWIGGRWLDFCNLSSWCVLPEYRPHGLALVGAVLAQPGLHFTNFTASLELLPIFRMLGFREMDNRLIYWPNVPFSLPWRATTVRLAPREATPGQERQLFLAHQGFPRVRCCWLGGAGEQALVVYRPRLWHGVGCAEILHLTEPALVLRHMGGLRQHLWRQGLRLSRVAQRLWPDPPVATLPGRDRQPRLFRSRELQEGVISTLYSELITFDL